MTNPNPNAYPNPNYTKSPKADLIDFTKSLLHRFTVTYTCMI